MANYPKNERNQIKFPSIQDVASDLRSCKCHCDIDGEEGVDVRLQVTEEGSWAIRVGDPQYDLDHRGCWGAGYLTRRTNCRELARDLIEEARDQAAFEDSIDRDEEF